MYVLIQIVLNGIWLNCFQIHYNIAYNFVNKYFKFCFIKQQILNFSGHSYIKQHMSFCACYSYVKNKCAPKKERTKHFLYSNTFFNSSIKVLISLNSLYTEAKRT